MRRLNHFHGETLPQFVSFSLLLRIGVRGSEGEIHMLEDIFKGGNIIAGLAIGIGAALLAPVVVPVLRPLAKSAIKAGMMAYDEAMVALAELNETAGDIFAEARSEMAEETTSNGAGGAAARSGRGRSKRATHMAS
jgi:hypothetical protein